MKTWKHYISKLRSFVSTIKEDSKVALVFDSDPDGICSAVLVSKALETRQKVIFTILGTILGLLGAWVAHFFGWG